MPKPQHRTPQTLDYDSAGGAILRHARPTTRPVIRNLRALDIHRSPQLETLDLTACAPGVHVGIRQAPRLRHILVPTGGHGAVIHVDAGRHAPVLFVTGAVDEIDACWQHGRFRLAAPGLPPWQNVALNTAPADTAEAVVLATDTGPLVSAFHANNALRDLHLLDQALPDDLDLAHLPHLSAVHQRRCTGARRITLPNGIQRLTITDQPDLAAITGSGHVLHVTRTPAAECSLHGLWSQALFDDARIRVLHAPLVRALELRGHPGVGSIHVDAGVRLTLKQPHPVIHADAVVTPVQDAGFAVDGLLKRLARGDDTAWEPLCRLCDPPATRGERFHRLLSLAGAVGTVNPQRLWRLRCRLHAGQAHRTPHRVNEKQAIAETARRWQWHWHIPQDRVREAFAADLHLAAAVSGTAIAEPFFRLLAKAHRPEHVAALADAVQRARSRGRRPLPTYTRTLHTAIPRCCRRLPRRRRAIDIDTVLSLIHGAVLTHNAEAAEAIRQLVNDHLKPEAALRALQCLVEHGHAPARSDLWVLATTASSADIRNRAQRAALAPARSTALTPATHEEPPHDHA